MSDEYVIEIIVDGKPVANKQPETPEVHKNTESLGILENTEIRDISASPPNQIFINGEQIHRYAIWLLNREVFFLEPVKPGQWVSFRWTFDDGKTFFDYGLQITEQTRYVKWGRPKKSS